MSEHDLGHYDSIIDEQIDCISRQVLRLAQTILEVFEPETVVDFGCGAGLYLLPFLGHGCAVLGLDGCPTAGALIKPFFMQADFCEAVDFGTDFELALCIEVAEHLPGSAAGTLVRSLTEASDTIVFSAATPGQGGYQHINEQPKSYWADLFSLAGFDVDPREEPLRLELAKQFYDGTWWLRRNVTVYSRRA